MGDRQIAGRTFEDQTTNGEPGTNELRGAAAVPPKPSRFLEPVDVVAEALRTWRVSPGPLWHSAQPPAAAALPGQGWKLHVSATPAAAAEVLARIVPALAEAAVPFKFAPTRRAVRYLCGRECDREQSGKVVTVYPYDDEQAVELAARLHEATRGLPGPRILSDRPYQPGSLVHYRYGGFTGRGELDNDGLFQLLLRAPDGSAIPDQRAAWFAPPEWAHDPFEPPATPPTRDAVLLGNRYVVREAIRHSTRGGIYAATDTGTDLPVVIKHARAHAEADLDGNDARTRLLHEARMLRRMHPHVAVPEPRAVFAQDGDLFLVMERLPGIPLRQWVRTRAAVAAGVPAPDALPMARRLHDLVATAHAAGVVIRDLSPANLLIDPDDVPRLVDLEAASPIGRPAPRAGTPGYRAPEHLDDSRQPGPPDQPVTAGVAEDLYSLGGLLFLLATGNDPVLPDDTSGPPGGAGARSRHDRLSAWLAEVARYGECARLLTPVMLELLADDPAERCDLSQLSERLPAGPPRTPATRAQCLTVALPTAEELLADGVEELIHAMTPDGERLWPAQGFGARTDPRNVQHGAAGALAVLVRAVADAPCEHRAGDLTSATRKATGWLADRIQTAEPGESGRPDGRTPSGRTLSERTPSGPVLPGLYFGQAGIAWALAEAASVLDEPQLLARSTKLLQRLPDDWPNPDVAHGLAGAALAHLQVGRLTGDHTVLDRLAGYAERLRTAAFPSPHGPLWPIPSSFPSQFAGACHYGFAHGVAGIGYTLLAAGRALEEPAYLDLACEAGYLLCRVAQLDEDGAAWWPVGPMDSTRLTHWCSGSSGVGTFLLRLLAVTGEQRFEEYSRAAAGAVYRARWLSSPAACHGLAGDGQFLLDAAEQLRDSTYQAWAEELVRLMAVRHCRRDGRALVPDESLTQVTLDYNTGLAGVVAFLLRLRHGGPRLFLADQVIADGWPEASRSWERPAGGGW